MARSDSISAAELLQLAEQPDKVLIDIRSARQYRQSHHPGSHWIPAGLLLAGELPDGELLLLGDDSNGSIGLIDQLHEQGYNRRIHYLEGGFAALDAAQTAAPAHSDNISVQERLQRLVGGPALVIGGALTQSLGLFALGLVLWLGPWAMTRGRA